MEIGVKNDEALIKMAAIIQRIESAQAKGSDGDMWDPSELAALLEESEEVKESVDEVIKEEDKDAD